MKLLFSSNSKVLRFSSQFCSYCREQNFDLYKVRFHIIAGNISVYRCVSKMDFARHGTWYVIVYHVDSDSVNLKV